jgi:NADH-ubiquinone oxidoreductase chain 5
MVMIGSLSLLAIPFLTGFYSKDMILEFTYARFNLDGFFLYILGICAAFFTAFYSTRLIY